MSDVEHEWITKYRAALDRTPIERSRFTGILAVVHDAKAVVMSKIGRAFTGAVSSFQGGALSKPSPIAISSVLESPTGSKAAAHGQQLRKVQQ